MISAFGVDHGISKGMRLPSGARVRFRTKMTHRKRRGINYETGETIPAGTPQFHELTAKVKGKKVGGMYIYHGQPVTHGSIGGLHTEEPYRRQGLATGMMRHMEERSSIPIRHSSALTDDGAAFAAKTPIANRKKS